MNHLFLSQFPLWSTVSTRLGCYSLQSRQSHICIFLLILIRMSAGSQTACQTDPARSFVYHSMSLDFQATTDLNHLPHYYFFWPDYSRCSKYSLCPKGYFGLLGKYWVRHCIVRMNFPGHCLLGHLRSTGINTLDWLHSGQLRQSFAYLPF